MTATNVPASLVPETYVTLTDQATIATNCALGRYFKGTLGADRVLGNPTGMVAGKVTSAIWRIDANGHALTYGVAFNWGSAGAPTLATVSYIGGIYNEDTSQWDMFDPSLGH